MNQDRFDISYAGNRIQTDASIHGNIKSEKDLCLDGFIEGNVQCKGLVIVNRGGEIDGDVACRVVYLNGVVTGNVCAESKAVLGADAVIKGSLTTACLEITPGAKIGLGLKLMNASK